MTVVIRHPRNRPAERSYILNVMFDEFLGLGIERIAEDRSDYCIAVGETGARLHVADVLFAVDAKDWMQPQSMPTEPLPHFQVPDALRASLPGDCDDIPVLYGRPGPGGRFFEQENGVMKLGIDIFGSAFFMLARYEEACSPARDSFGRFPYSASLSSREHFNERPIVNEYLEVLWSCLVALAPGLKRKSSRFECVLTHDVDRLFDTRGKSWPSVARNALGDLARRADPGMAARRIYSKAVSTEDDFRHEPCSRFDFIMDNSERIGVKSAFNFIPNPELDERNGDYTIDMPWVRRLIRTIDDRGHELGLHASYESFDHPEKISEELSRLRAVASREGVGQDIAGGRQHYLRWAAGRTWEAWNDAGLEYDSTVAYAESCGFRCGTCYEFPVFSLSAGEALELRERPMVVMETSLLGRNYMGLAGHDVLDTINRLSSTCRQYGGLFTMLWHNDKLASRRVRRLYLGALEAVT